MTSRSFLRGSSCCCRFSRWALLEYLPAAKSSCMVITVSSSNDKRRINELCECHVNMATVRHTATTMIHRNADSDHADAGDIRFCPSLVSSSAMCAAAAVFPLVGVVSTTMCRRPLCGLAQSARFYHRRRRLLSARAAYALRDLPSGVAAGSNRRHRFKHHTNVGQRNYIYIGLPRRRQSRKEKKSIL